MAIRYSRAVQITASVGVGADQATIDGKAFAADQSFGNAAGEHMLKQAPQEITVAEVAAMVLREG